MAINFKSYLKDDLAAKFNWFIILSVTVTILLISTSITVYLINRFDKEVHQRDRLQLKGLTSSVKGLVEIAYSLNSLLAINQIIIDNVAGAHPDWQRRYQEYNQKYDISTNSGPNRGLPLLVEMHNRYDFVELFFVQDENGDQTARSYGEIGHRGKRWWFKQFTNNSNYQPFVSKSYYSMTGNKPVSSVFHPIFKDNRFIGIIGLDINFDKIQQLVNNYIEAEDLNALVIDNEGVIIANPARAKVYEIVNLRQLTREVLLKTAEGQTVQNITGYHQTQTVKLDWPLEVSLLVKKAINGQHGIIEDILFDGMESTVYYDPVPLPGRGSHKNYAVLLIRNNKSINRTKLIICGFVLIFTVISIIILFFVFRLVFGKVVLKPVHQLTQAMNMADSNAHKRVILNTNDEFQILAETYNWMREKMVTDNRKLLQLNQELEQRIEKHREIENQLRDSEERYRSLHQNVPVGLYRSSPEGRFLSANQTLVYMLGYASREEFLQLKTTDIYEIPEQRTEVLNILNREGIIENSEIKLKRKDGSVLWTSVSAKRINSSQGTITYDGIIQDISDRKKVEEEKQQLQRQLQQSQKMESIGTLAGGIAHDFNNILFPIIGYTEMVLEDLPQDGLPFKNLNEVLKAAKRAKNLVHQILTFSRQRKEEYKPLIVKPVLKEVIKMLRAAIPTTIEIKTDIDNTANLILGNPTQIHQIVMNLCTNACHAMLEARGVLSIGLKEVTFDTEKRIDGQKIPAGIYQQLYVNDTGEGMDEATRQRIFEPYFTTKAIEKGTGLGLSVVHGIVSGAGGYITVKSAPQKGSQFSIYFPVLQNQTLSEPFTTAKAVKGGHERILLVDDEAFIVKMEKQMLERLGYKVTVQTDSIEALKCFTEQPYQFDLVMADMTMPHMTGSMLALEIKTIRPDIPIIVSTGYAEQIDEQGTSMQAVDRLITKPLMKIELAETLRDLLD